MVLISSLPPEKGDSRLFAVRALKCFWSVVIQFMPLKMIYSGIRLGMENENEMSFERVGGQSLR